MLERESVNYRVCVESDLSLSHKISCDGHVLEEDGKVESAVTFAVCDGGICSVSHQLDHHGEVALPHYWQKPQTALWRNTKITKFQIQSTYQQHFGQSKCMIHIVFHFNWYSCDTVMYSFFYYAVLKKLTSPCSAEMWPVLC